MTTRHIMQMASEPQETQIILMRHQCTDLPTNTQKKTFMKHRPSSHKNEASDRQNNYNKSLMPRICTRTRSNARSVEIQFILKVSSVQQRNFNASLVTGMDTLHTYVIKINKFHSRQGNQRPIYCKWELCICVKSPYVATQKIVHPAMSHSVCK